MVRRLTQKQETFCLNLFEGMSQRDAYIAAGYSPRQSPGTLDRHAYELANNDYIMARWDKLRQKAEDASQATVLERKQVLTEILRARLTDYITCGPDRDLINVGPESPNTAALQEVTSRTEYDKDGTGVAVVTKLKLHNPMTAIDTLNKMDKLYIDGAAVNIDNRTLIINVNSEKAKGLTERLIEGERTGGDNGH